MKTDKHEIVYEMYFNEPLSYMGINQMILVNGDIDIESWILIPR